jgi:AcrR family transcriptional regulator
MEQPMASRPTIDPVSQNRPRGRRTKEMPDGRQALLAAAARMFARYGFQGVDVRSIAAEANVSPNLVRVHFGSKAALWEACLDAIVTEAKHTFADVAKISGETVRSLRERLRDVIVRVAAFYSANPEVRDFVARHGADTPERATLVTERLLRPAYESSRELFEEGIKAGIIRSSHPALFFALLNVSLSQPPNFPTLLNRLAPEIEADAARARLIETVVATFLHLPSSDPDAGS